VLPDRSLLTPESSIGDLSTTDGRAIVWQRSLQGRVFKVSTPDLDGILFFVALLTSRKKIWRVSAADRHKQQEKKCLNFYNGHLCLASFSGKPPVSRFIFKVFECPEFKNEARFYV